MEKDAAGKVGDRERKVDTGNHGQPPATDAGGDGTLRPAEAHPDEGEEGVGLRLTKVVRRQGGQSVNKISGVLDVWYEEQTFVPKDGE